MDTNNSYTVLHIYKMIMNGIVCELRSGIDRHWASPAIAMVTVGKQL